MPQTDRILADLQQAERSRDGEAANLNFVSLANSNGD